jgi:hypothetical protein
VVLDDVFAAERRQHAGHHAPGGVHLLHEPAREQIGHRLVAQGDVLVGPVGRRIMSQAAAPMRVSRARA